MNDTILNIKYENLLRVASKLQNLEKKSEIYLPNLISKNSDEGKHIIDTYGKQENPKISVEVLMDVLKKHEKYRETLTKITDGGYIPNDDIIGLFEYILDMAEE